MLIGTSVTDWSTVEGAYYAGGGTEAIWLGLSLLVCVIALIAGSRHERAACRKAK
jgi:hypothetical protein